MPETEKTDRVTVISKEEMDMLNRKIELAERGPETLYGQAATPTENP